MYIFQCQNRDTFLPKLLVTFRGQERKKKICNISNMKYGKTLIRSNAPQGHFFVSSCVKLLLISPLT